jgi:hypothetical protein
MYDPSLLMRGRYLSLQPTVDGCQSTLPFAKQGSAPAKLEVKDNKLVAVRLPGSGDRPSELWVEATPGSSCEQMRLTSPVDFYISEHGPTPTVGEGGGQLWIEMTLPPQGPPRPIQLARKLTDGTWKPLAFQ